MALKSLPEFDHVGYMAHGLTMSDAEIAMRDTINQELPPAIVDCHTHASRGIDFDQSQMNEFTWKHMVSTYPITTLEQSYQISNLFFPGHEVQKVRFAHAFRGISHAAVNEYLTEDSDKTDRVALFGIHDDEEGIEYTIEELKTGKYAGLKMYYAAGASAKYELFEYFPRPILRQAERSDTPIILHLPNGLSKSCQEIDILTEQYPSLRVILPHAGVTWVDDGALEQTFGRLQRHANILIDTSGVSESTVLQKAIQMLGNDRVLFGSDEPLNLLREQVYMHPRLGPRILTDYPYHWVDDTDLTELPTGDYIPQYNHLLQVSALIEAIKASAATEAHRQAVAQAIFHDNAHAFFGF